MVRTTMFILVKTVNYTPVTLIVFRRRIISPTLTENYAPRPMTVRYPWETWTVRETPTGLLLTRIILVVLTVVLDFTVFTVTLTLVWASMGVLPTLLLIKVRPLPFPPLRRSLLMPRIPLVGRSLSCIRLTLSLPVIVLVILPVLFASTIASVIFIDPRVVTVVPDALPIILETTIRFVHPLPTDIRTIAFVVR